MDSHEKTMICERYDWKHPAHVQLSPEAHVSDICSLLILSYIRFMVASGPIESSRSITKHHV